MVADRGIVVPGDPDGSEIIRRTEVAEDDDDHMPPRGESIPPEGVALIRKWIAQGALLTAASPTPTTTAPTVSKPVENTTTTEQATGQTQAPPPPAPISLDPAQIATRDAAIARLNERGALAKRVALNDDAVEVSFALVGGDVTDADLDLLSGLESSLIWLDLAGTGITDSGVAKLASFSKLRRVELQRTSISDAALSTLAKLPELRVANLYQTAVTDQGLQALRPLEQLERVYVWGTKVSATGAANLRAARPSLEIDLGGSGGY